MTDFVLDNTTLPNGKTDARSLRGPAGQAVSAAEWNTAMQAIYDLRTNLNALVFNVKRFGADSTGATPSHVAVQNAIDAAAAVKGRVYFPAGTYLFEDSLTNYEGVVWFGESRLGSVLKWHLDTSTDAIIVHSPTPLSAYIQGCGFLDLRIRADDPSWIRDLISCNVAGPLVMDNCTVEGAGRYGLYALDGIDMTISHSTFNTNTSAGVYLGTAGASVQTSTRFNNCYFTGSPDGAGADVAGIGLAFHECVFESNGLNTPANGHGIKVRSGTADILSCYFENNAMHDMWIGSTANAAVTITNPLIRIGPNTDAAGIAVFFDRTACGNLLGGDLSARAEQLTLGENSVGVFAAGFKNTVAVTYDHPTRELHDYPGFIMAQDPGTGFYMLFGASHTGLGPLAGHRWLRSDQTSAMFLTDEGDLDIDRDLAVGRDAAVTGLIRLNSGTPWTEGLTGSTSEIHLNNGSVDSPGIAFYTGNSQSMGIDATSAGGLRFLKDPNTATGAAFGSLDRSGNIGFVGNAYFNQQAGKHASTAIQVDSTTQGCGAVPRMTTTQKNNISSPMEGLLVYDLTLHKLCVYTGGAWETVTSV